MTTEHSGNRADLHKTPENVSGMFDQVAAGYDRTNFLLTFGMEKLWRVATTKAIEPRPGQKILDLAAGTGASSVVLARSGAAVVAGDFSKGMIAEGIRRHGDVPGVTFQQADALDLPFDDDEFDTVTISYGLRNVNDPAKALSEMLRVTKPGGRIVIAEFSHVHPAWLASLYKFYNARILPTVARIVSSNDVAYDYLNESIADWPDQKTLAGMMRQAGWDFVEHRDLTFGIVALHRGTKPAAENESAR